MELRDVSGTQYTPGQAAAKKSQIQMELAEAELATRRMHRVIPDHPVDLEAVLAPLRELAYQLETLADRRTRA